MNALFLAVTLAATPLGKARLALPDVQAAGIDAKLTAFFGEHLGTQLKLAGVEVITSREISSLLGLERQAALLGCADNATSCMTELASALGADGVVLVDLARLGRKTQVNLKIISATDGRTLGVWAERVDGDEEIADTLSAAAQQMAKQVQALRSDGPTSLGVESPMSRRVGLGRLWWAPTAVGGGLLVSGAIVFALGKVDHDRLATGSGVNVEESTALRRRGPTLETAGVALLVSGAAVAAAGVGLLLFGTSTEAQVAFVPSNEGAGLTVSGRFP